MDDEHMEFPLHASAGSDEPRIFTSCEEAAGFPVADAVLAVPGVVEARLSSEHVTVRKAPGHTWSALEPALQYAITTASTSSGSALEAEEPERTDDDALFERVADLFQREINPAVARHGGRIELIDVQERTVVLRMQGGCQGCGMATVTLRQGIEAQLRRLVPGVAGVRDITDHAGGRNPYFQASTK